MIIDAHNHPDWLGKDFEQCIEDMDRYHIDKTCILTWECPDNEYGPVNLGAWNVNLGLPGVFPASFEQCLIYKKRAPERFILGFAPDPRHPAALERLQAAIDLYQVQMCGEIKLRMMYDNPDALALFRFAGKKNLPVTLHLETPYYGEQKYPRSSWWYGGDMDTLERVLQKCPDTVFLGHALAFWAAISGDADSNPERYPKGTVTPGGRLPELLRKYPNLYCDISAGSGLNAFARDLSFAAEFMDEFQDRIIYARDCFGNEHQELINSLKLNETALEKIYWKNISRLLGEKIN